MARLAGSKKLGWASERTVVRTGDGAGSKPSIRSTCTAWDGARYQWRRGAWKRPPYEGAYWNHPHYDHDEQGWVVHEGHWDHEDHGDHHDWDHHDHGDHHSATTLAVYEVNDRRVTHRQAAVEKSLNSGKLKEHSE
jgi:hypothetical protein